ncbi:asparagine synthase (glutamine-hydrolyzing) [Actinoplanes sp. Pm04-4]|uniref:asparagine synthase (glutamine-hydrolyzing) n=1 Tax=Paractinoplanes pyxinae TaxID=2997416 RepID=A0ABT4BEU9_9ACTN|nr:asparagine synthase (glutamine-hydrolyzing) [Actinoplanes pyxinae]MCY1144103.1 asparagine synthase (glutamine-hydrolyzing) [Actinoplanes pyxinae]
MCGITGCVEDSADSAPLSARVSQMAASIAHRGPNGTHVRAAVGGTAALGMNTLAILAGEDRLGPYQDAGTGCLLTFNGEIYNWRELARQWKIDLQAGDSDALVVLEGYLRLGSDVLRHLEGMFALAIYDPRDATLLLARDRFGEKPLYWSVEGARLTFASEVKALDTVDKLTRSAPPSWLTLETPLTDQTPWDSVRMLPPGAMLRFNARSHRIEQQEYWRLRDIPVSEPTGDVAKQFTELLLGAVDRCRPAEPLALAVSGGLDSAVLAYTMRPELLVTVQYPGIPQLDELEQVRAIADDLGTELVVLQPSAAEFREHARDIVRFLDYPVGNASVFSEYMLYREIAARGVRVVAGGIGPDEFLMGYIRHHLILEGAELISREAALASYQPMAQKFARHEQSSDRAAERYFQLIKRGPDLDPAAQRLVYEQFQAAGDLGQALTLTDLAVSFPPLLLTSDKLSSAFGLERRSPYLDRTFAEFSYALPVRYKKYSSDGAKYLLRTAARKLGVPRIITEEQNKRGFGSPLPTWLRGELAAWCDAELTRALADPDLPPVLRLSLRRARQPQAGEYDRTRLHALTIALWWNQYGDPKVPAAAATAMPALAEASQ